VSDAVRVRSSNFGMQGTPISVALLRWRGAGAPDAGRLGEREVVEFEQDCRHPALYEALTEGEGNACNF
jgi:hypothetical protein